MVTKFRLTIAFSALFLSSFSLYAQEAQAVKPEPIPATADDLRRVTSAIKGLVASQKEATETVGKSLKENTEALINANKQTAEQALEKSSARTEILLNQRLREEALQRENAERRYRNLILGGVALVLIAMIGIVAFVGYWMKKGFAGLEKRALAFSHMMLKRNDTHTKILLSSETSQLIGEFEGVVESALRKVVGHVPAPSVELAIKEGSQKVFDTPILRRIHLDNVKADHGHLMMTLLDYPTLNERWREDGTVDLPMSIRIHERTPGVGGIFNLTVHLTREEETSYAVFDDDSEKRRVALRNTLNFAIGLATKKAQSNLLNQEIRPTVN